MMRNPQPDDPSCFSDRNPRSTSQLVDNRLSTHSYQQANLGQTGSRSEFESYTLRLSGGQQ